MSEAKNKAKIEKPKISRMAIISFLLVIINFILLFIAYGYGHRIPESLILPGILLYVILFLSIFVLCIITYIKIFNSEGKLTGKPFLKISLVFLIIFLIIPSICHPPFPQVSKTTYRMLCGTNLACLGKALYIYKDDFGGKYPPPDKWCDLILKTDLVYKKQFICKNDLNVKFGRDADWCSYAMNPNAEPNSSKDIVLLFECKGGWNQFGGAELLNPDNHQGRGCNILFNDGHVKFVKKEDFGKLKWKDKEVSTQEQGNKE